SASGELRIMLPLQLEEPQLDATVLAQAEARAQQLIASSIVLTHEWGELKLSPQVLAAMLRSDVRSPKELALDLDDPAIDTQLAPLRVALERPSANARFIVEKDDKLRIEPSATARRISTAQVEQAIWNAAQLPARSAALPITEVDEATLTTEQASALGISKKVSSFVTYFPCCQPRVKNIARMAELLDGTVLRPGETLSVNERVGERTRARGFVAGPTIVEGEMEDTFGGGVSQFATTLFNAVLNGGYQMIERQAHSYYFPRYPMGHEATLSFPKPDLIFKNDTQFGLLIQARCAKTSIRITLYGDNEGRKVERKLSHAFDFTDPKVDYVPNDKLKPDENDELERGSRGFSVVVTRIVTYANGQRSEEARKVVYKPREAVVAVHPCNIPKEDDDHTGEDCPKLELEEGETAPDQPAPGPTSETSPSGD
ncbi:MAG TPA: VanW family protein, partial [Polyangiaceae bacterium]|nr:VanW family protein [Polyangiaceae bacterium]